MQWAEFVEWTDQTAGNDNLDGLCAGVVEECFEAIEVWCALQTLHYGGIKRKHRGDVFDEEHIQARADHHADICASLVVEVGDALWYAARVQRVEGEVMPPNDAGGERSIDVICDAKDDWQSFGTRSRWAFFMASAILTLSKVDTGSAIAAVIEKLSRRKVEGTIMGEGER